MKTKELLEAYYLTLSQKSSLDPLLSDDFKFIGGDMTKQEPVIGKQAYIEVINRFGRLFKTMRVKGMIVDGDKACVRANYDYVFPNGKAINGDVAEVWEVRNGRLDKLTIFFDTLSFQQLLTK